MNFSATFIARPVATLLLTLGVVLAGILAYVRLPIAPLPQIDFPTILVVANLPGASPDTVARSVAAPLERYLGQIADVTQMTSESAPGLTRITLQFGLDRDLDGASRDVEAAINAARADLPSDLRLNPTYRKVNPANAPILVLAMTSETLTNGELYGIASDVLQQRLSQLPGVGQLVLGGSALPAVRVELNPKALIKYGMGIEDVRAALAAANANSPKGSLDEGDSRLQLYTNDQAVRSKEYAPLIVGWRDGAPVSLDQLGEVVDSVEDLRNVGLYNGRAAVLAIVYRQPGANVITTIDAVKAELPHLQAAMHADVHISLIGDPSSTIRASLRETQLTLLIAVLLVTAVVFVFLLDWRATLIPALAVPTSIVGTFGAMYLAGFSLDNLSLMALTVSIGFVADDAIVVVENVFRHMEAGMSRGRAALRGVQEVGFTVISISVSLIAVFVPIIFMGGIVGRLFREFALTLTIAIVASLVISLSTTPMLCALLLRRGRRTARVHPGFWERLQSAYASSLNWALGHPRLIMGLLLATIALNFVLFAAVSKGFFPEQDTGRLLGSMTADQSISFQLLRQKLTEAMDVIRTDPAVDRVVGFSGGGGGGRSQTNIATVYISLKPRAVRPKASDVGARLRQRLSQMTGASLYLVPVQDISASARQTSAAYQFTLQSDNSDELYAWTPKLVAALRRDNRLIDVSSDQQQGGLGSHMTIDRDVAARLGITPQQIDNALYDAFGQRQVSVIYGARSQRHVVMEVAPRFAQDSEALKQIWVSTQQGAPSGSQITSSIAASSSANIAGTAGIGPGSAIGAAPVSGQLARNISTNSIGSVGHAAVSSGAAVSTAKETMVPLSAVVHEELREVPLTVSHQGTFVATTVSFNLPHGHSLGEAVKVVEAAERQMGMSPTIRGSFSGAAQVFRQSLADEPLLIAAAILAMYLVLGILYESFVHPVTILSSLPSAGVGAILALMMSRTDFTIIALIGLILLIGIVKKNAIMMIDFAIALRRDKGASSRDAITEACRLRFRPIMMATMSALLGAMPLILTFGEGSELRRPLGLTITGGLLVSQLLTLYTTPVVYLVLERFRAWAAGRWRSLHA